ncbi:MAG TPA: cyclic-phosphate processing receiver domain-containing protein [Nitrospira sp.]|nr:cyclic-phosphate processing receiver domain-containing protein [Nitrospira sp.]
MPDAYLVHEIATAIELIDRTKPTHIFLDYDLGPGVDSSSVAECLARTGFSGEIVITSRNPFGQSVLARLLPRATVAPFGEFEIIRG